MQHQAGTASVHTFLVAISLVAHAMLLAHWAELQEDELVRPLPKVFITNKNTVIYTLTHSHNSFINIC